MKTKPTTTVWNFRVVSVERGWFIHWNTGDVILRPARCHRRLCL